MKYIFATILGIFEIVILGPLDAILGFMGWHPSWSRNVIDEIDQERHEANWRRDFQVKQQFERTSRNPFLDQSKSKTMQWGRSSQKRKAKP